MTTSSPPAEVAQLAEAITALLRQRPVMFADLLRVFPDAPYRTILLAWGQVRDRHRLARDDEGNYLLPPAA